jgi:hypothetical protein
MLAQNAYLFCNTGSNLQKMDEKWGKFIFLIYFSTFNDMAGSHQAGISLIFLA